jgi:hypothetical protein
MASGESKSGGEGGSRGEVVEGMMYENRQQSD